MEYIMYSIKYGVRVSEGYINSTFFQVNEEIKEQAIKNAEKRWNNKEVQNSLERSRQKCKKVEEAEKKRDEIKLAGSKIRVTQWLNDCLKAEYGKQLKLKQNLIKAKLN